MYYIIRGSLSLNPSLDKKAPAPSTYQGCETAETAGEQRHPCFMGSPTNLAFVPLNQDFLALNRAESPYGLDRGTLGGIGGMAGFERLVRRTLDGKGTA